MIKLINIFWTLLAVFLASCVPQNQATQVTCDPGSVFNAATRQCETVKIVKTFSLYEGATSRYIISDRELLANPPVSCELLSISLGIAAKCICESGGCYIQISPDDSTDPTRISDPAYPNFQGHTDLVFRLFDGSKYSNSVWLDVDVLNIDDPPYVEDQALSISTEGQKRYLQLDVTEVDGDKLTYSYNQPSFGDIYIDGTGMMTIDFSASNPNNDSYDIHYDGVETITYTVSDGRSTAYGHVTVTVNNATNDLPEILSSDVLALQNDLNARADVKEEGIFSITLPYSEYDSNQTGLECSVDVSGSGGKLTVMQPCACLSGVCQVTLQGAKDQFGTTQFSYTVSTGTTLPATDTTATQVVNFSLDDVDDPPVAQYDTIAYPNTDANVSSDKYRIYFHVTPADHSADDLARESDSSLTYTISTLPAAGILYKCNNSTDTTCSSATAITTGQTFAYNDNLYYIPTDTTTIGSIWQASTLTSQGITYTAKRLGTWGDNISIIIDQSSDVPNYVNVVANVSAPSITVIVNNSTVDSERTTAAAVCNAIAADDSASALVSVHCDDPAAYQFSNTSSLSGGVDGVDQFSYTVADPSNGTDDLSMTSIVPGVVFFTGEGVKETVGRDEIEHFAADESPSNIPLTYTDISVNSVCSVANGCSYVESTLDTDIPAGVVGDNITMENNSFDTICLSSTTKCRYQPVDGDVVGKWSATHWTVAMNSGAGTIDIYARHLGTGGDNIHIKIADNGVVSGDSAQVSIDRSNPPAIDINVEVDSGVTTAQTFLQAIINHPVADGLIIVPDPNTVLATDLIDVGAETIIDNGTDGVAYIRYWHSAPPASNVMGVLYIDLSDIVDSTTKTFDAPTLCHYGSAFDYPECGETGCIGTESPKNNIVPSKAGIYYYQQDVTDTTAGVGLGGICYRSTGTDKSDWEIVSDKNLYLGANYANYGDVTFFQVLNSDSTYKVVLEDGTADGVTAGNETVSVSTDSNDATITLVTVKIEAGVTTATQLKAALDGDPIVNGIIYTFINGDSNAVVNAGTAALTSNSGESFTINEKDQIIVKRIRLDEGDGIDLLNKIDADNDGTNEYESSCKISLIASTNETLVPKSSVEIEFGGATWAEGSSISLGGTSIDSQVVTFKVTPSTSIVGSSFIRVQFECTRPDVSDLNGLTSDADADIPCHNGANCNLVQNSIGTTGTTGVTDTVDIIFKVQVNEASIGHNGWKNIVALGPKIDIYGHVLDSCPYALSGCSTSDGQCTGDSSPVSLYSAAEEGVFFYDKNSAKCYVSTAANSTTAWKNADCSVSYSYDEPECNGAETSVDECIGTGAPLFTPAKKNSMYYDNSGKDCYRSVNTTAQTDWKLYRGTGQVYLQWENFTFYTSGQQAESFNIYRKFKDEAEFDYERPLNRDPIPATQNYYVDNIKNSYQAPVPGTVYDYEVRPIVNGIPTSAGTSTFQVIRVAVPPPNMAFVSRRIVNKTVCKLMNKIPDAANYNRCAYQGIGATKDATTGELYYDIGSDYLVDRFEQGCPYTIATKVHSGSGCSTADGCIGSGDPDGSLTGAGGEVYYDRDDGKCYVNSAATGATGTAWTQVTTADAAVVGLMQQDSDGNLIDAANVFLSRVAHVPPLTGVTQEQANTYCGNLSVTTTQLSGLQSNATFKLPNRREQIAYSLWDDDNLDDTDITSIEQGLDLLASHKCNSSAASGVEDNYIDNGIPGASIRYTLPGTKSSGIRSFYTGSELTDTCVSRFGVQDAVGNVNEWLQDVLFCPTPYTCEFVNWDGSAYESSYFASLTGQTFTGNEDEDQQFFNQWSYSSTSNYCLDSSDNRVECYGDGDPGAASIKPSGVGVRYLDRQNHVIYRSTGSTSADWELQTDSDGTTDLSAINRSVPNALSSDTSLWESQLFDGAFDDTVTSDNEYDDFYIYRFDGKRGPCYDLEGTESCNGELTGWYIPTPDVLSAEKFFVPMGMPAATNISNNVVVGSNFEAVAEEALPINSSGISSSRLHNDYIQIYSKQIYLASGCGSMLAGGGYESGDKAGVYSSQFTTCTDPTDTDTASDQKPSSAAVGFRCIAPIDIGN